MTYGFSCINSSGRIQIDGITRNNRVLASGTSVGNASAEATIYYPNIGAYPLIYISVSSSGLYMLEIQQNYARIKINAGVSFDWIAVVPEFSTSSTSNTYGIVLLGEPTAERPTNVIFSSDREGQPVVVGSLKIQMYQGSSFIYNYDFSIPQYTLYNTYVLLNSIPFVVYTKTGGVQWVTLGRPSQSIYRITVRPIFGTGASTVRYSAEMNFVIPFVRLL